MEIIAMSAILSTILLKINSDNNKIFNRCFSELNDSKEREEKMFEHLDKFGKSLDSFNNTLTKIDKRLEAVEKKQKKECL